jgi:hypothetical protein
MEAIAARDVPSRAAPVIEEVNVTRIPNSTPSRVRPLYLPRRSRMAMRVSLVPPRQE